jgi:hypothetical protein
MSSTDNRPEYVGKIMISSSVSFFFLIMKKKKEWPLGLEILNKTGMIGEYVNMFKIRCSQNTQSRICDVCICCYKRSCVVEVGKRVIVIQLAEVFGWWLYYTCSWQGGDRVPSRRWQQYSGDDSVVTIKAVVASN